ncbi:MAG TPA: acyl-CoA desaturase [Edaphocola sp.]|nr:acyl-CoA desaturase [Edaphocola sp.]
MPKVSYNNKRAVFFPALKKEIDAYFADLDIKKTGSWRLFSKTIILLCITVILYCFVMFVPMPGLPGIFLCGLLGFALALVGFNIMHDACHGSYSDNKTVNEMLGYTLNLIGGNSFLWKQKHNILHHTYTNVDGKDDDIAKSPFIRMCSTQKWVAAHRVQHLYLPLLYAISSLFWIFWQDFYKYFTKKIYTSKLPEMSRREHFAFWAGKVFYICIYIVLPVILHGWAAWLIGFLVLNAILGLATSIVFQLAHVVEETEFVYVGVDDAIIIENEWAVHQVRTTVNFSPGSKIITYLSGGLNYQVEHHLFPRISHIHYPSISKIVRKKCAEFNLPYLSTPTFSGALFSHFRLIHQLGMKP